MLTSSKILLVGPRKDGDPLEYTYQWFEKAVQFAKDRGYNVRTIEKEETTYENVTRTIKEFKPRLFVAFSHGCPNSLQGNKNCMLMRKYTQNEICDLIQSNDPSKIEVARKMLFPLGGISCPGICKLDSDPCNPLCVHDTNINELKGSIILAVACFSALQLGKCSIKHGIESYVGYKDLFMFPTDSLNSQDFYGDVQLEFFKNLLMGKTVGESEFEMAKMEDDFIRKNKKIKYLSLPLLWNKLNRQVHGNKNATLY